MKSYIDGLTECLSRLEKLEKSVSSKSTGPMRKAMEDLADAGHTEWRTAYDSLGDVDDGVNDAVVDLPRWQGDTLVLEASGDNLLFLEFGTGVRHNYKTKYGSQYGYYPSSWSAGPGGKGWLVGGMRRAFHGKWPLPKGVIPSDTRGAQYDKKVVRHWMTKKYGARTRTYHYHRDTPFAYWAEGHRPANGMYKAMRVMQSRAEKDRFIFTLLNSD